MADDLTRDEQLDLLTESGRSPLAEKRALIDELIASTQLYSSRAAVEELLAFTVRLRDVAPFNAMLLHVQKPGISYVATARDWQERFRRKPLPHARPLLVLRLFGPVDFVYDVLDTEGADLPKSAYSFPTEGRLASGWLHSATECLSRAEIELINVDQGDRRAGSVCMILETESKDALNHFRIEVNRNHPVPTQFVTLMHELGHLYLGHCGANAKRGVKRRGRPSLARREVEAETVAWLVAKRSGISPRSESYLDRYKEGFENLDLHAVMQAAGRIEQLLRLPLI